MTKHQDLTKRLIQLGIKIFYLGEYSFADCYDYDEDAINGLAEDIERDLSGTIIGLPDGYKIHKERLNLIDNRLLEKWEKEMGEITEKIQSDEIYQQLVKAYNSNNQSEIARLMSSVFSPKLLKYGKTLYHGVTPRKITQGIGGLISE